MIHKDLSLELEKLWRALVPDNFVCEFQFAVEWPLGGADALDCIHFKAASGGESFLLQGGTSGYHDHPICWKVATRLVEQWNLRNQKLAVSAAGQPLSLLTEFLIDEGMQNFLQPEPYISIRENPLTETRTADAPVLIEHRASKGRSNFATDFFAVHEDVNSGVTVENLDPGDQTRDFLAKGRLS